MSDQEHTNVYTEQEDIVELTEVAIPTAPDSFCFDDAFCDTLDNLQDIASQPSNNECSLGDCSSIKEEPSCLLSHANTSNSWDIVDSVTIPDDANGDQSLAFHDPMISTDDDYFIKPKPKAMPFDPNLYNKTSTAIDAAALQFERERTTVKFPWETGFAGKVLNQTKTEVWPWCSTPVVGRLDYSMGIIGNMSSSSSASVTCLEQSVCKPVLPHALRRLRMIQYTASEDSVRQRSIVRWRLLVEHDLNATHVGQLLSKLSDSLSSEAEIIQILEDTFAPKSTATLYKRVASIEKYFSWCNGQSIPSPMMFNEPDVYSYISYLRRVGSASTVADSFRQAVVFASSLLGSNGDIQSIHNSNRIKGAVHSMFIQKRKLKQAPALSVSMVLALEEAACNLTHPHERVIAGHLCFALYSSARFSDSVYLDELNLKQYDDVYLVEAATSKHKTSTSKEKTEHFAPSHCYR